MLVSFFVNGNNISFFPFRRKNTFTWTSFLEGCRWKNHIFLTREYWYYHDHELYLGLSFELFKQCRLERKLQKISDCYSNNEDAKGVCCCFLLRCIALQQNALKSSAFSLKSVINLFSWNNDGIKRFFLLLKKTI